jgi:cytidylate kinase
VRVKTVAAREKLSEREATRLIEHTDAERRAFVMRYHRADFTDPTRYDLALNTERLGVEGALEAVRGALATLKKSRKH